MRIGHRAERDQTIAAAVEIPELQSCIAFAAAQLRARNQLTQIGITAFVLDQQHEARGIFERELAADDRCDARAARGTGKAYGAIEPVAIGERDRRELELDGASYQRFGM